MDKKRDKISPHKSKFVKQIVYYMIVVILQIRYLDHIDILKHLLLIISL